MTYNQIKKHLAALHAQQQRDPEIRHAEIIVQHVAECCATGTMPNDKVKAEFNRLRKLGYIGSDEHMFWVNYQNAKQ